MEVPTASKQEKSGEVKVQRMLPIYRSTRARLRHLKKEMTWDELVNEMADVYEEVR